MADIIEPSCPRCNSLNITKFITKGEEVLKWHCKGCALVFAVPEKMVVASTEDE